MKPAKIQTGKVTRTAPFLSAGLLNAAEGTTDSTKDTRGQGPNGGGLSSNQVSSGQGVGALKNLLGVAPKSLGCSGRNANPDNFRVNQDCTYRDQAEEIIKYNPADPNNLVAGMNDRSQGFNYSAFAYSFDAGHTWGNWPPPFYMKINDPSQEEPGCNPGETPPACDPNAHTIVGGPGNGFTYDGGSDPIIAADLEGRAFYGAVIFDRFVGNGSAVVVSQSPAGAGGSFYDNIRPFDRHFVVAEDNDLSVFHDKPFLTADINPASPNRDNLYVTWTVFRFGTNCGPGGVGNGQDFNYCQSPIFGSMSTDHARTWSTPELVSGTADGLCFFGNIFQANLPAASCNLDQGADPTTLPNGDLVVVFNNGNTAADNPNAQQLSVKCHPTGSSPLGTAHLNCGTPAKVGSDFVIGEPQCDFGRGPEECIPGAFVRTNDFPRIAVNYGTGNLYATWQDYRNGEFDIQLSQSTNGGVSWTESAAPVNPDRGKDHYEPAIDVVCSDSQFDQPLPSCRRSSSTGSPSGGSPSGQQLCPSQPAGTFSASTQPSPVNDHVGVSYYRTCRVPGEEAGGVFTPDQPGVLTSNSDYFLAGGRSLRTPYADKRVAKPFLPPVGRDQTGFMGDYSGLTIVADVAHPIWADPRNPVPDQFQADVPSKNDDDTWSDSIGLPDGQAIHNE